MQIALEKVVVPCPVFFTKTLDKTFYAVYNSIVQSYLYRNKITNALMGAVLRCIRTTLFQRAAGWCKAVKRSYTISP